MDAGVFPLDLRVYVPLQPALGARYSACTAHRLNTTVCVWRVGPCMQHAPVIASTATIDCIYFEFHGERQLLVRWRCISIVVAERCEARW